MRAWLRVQEGTSHLRALLYVDELYGMMPPHPANPPTKAPLLALLKQARSQGLGLVLASQNPVDLDYKGLANAGTWFVGKLQTANDRQRALEGLQALEGQRTAGRGLPAATALGGQTLDEAIATLKPRTFLLHNVHDPGPVLFQTRHTMSYLRGPLTRRQIRRWMKIYEPRQALEVKAPLPDGDLVDEEPLPDPGRPDLAPAPVESATRRPQPELIPAPAESATRRPQPGPALPWDAFPSEPPSLPGGIDQHFLPVHVPLEWAIRDAESGGRSIVYQARQLVYRPALLARATVRIDNNTHNVHQERAIVRALPGAESVTFIDWENESIPVDADDLDDRPAQGARYAPLLAGFADARRLRSLERDFSEYVYRESAVTLTRHPLLKLTSRPDEGASEFRLRCYKAIEGRRDQEVRKLEQQTEDKVARLEARIRREERELEQDELEYEGRKREEWITAGESVLNLLRRRRHSRMLSIASRKRRLTRQARADIEESLQAIDDLEAQIEELLDEADREKARIQARWAESTDDFESILVRPRKSDIYVEAWSAVWLPYWEILYKERGGMEHLSLAAFETLVSERLVFERQGDR